jgi:hypothetical protein
MRIVSVFSVFLIFHLNAQNVGINTSTPVAALDVQSAGNSSATMAVSVSNSGNDTLVVVRDNGNVGIGTTQPGAPLDVQTQGNLAARFSAPVEGQPAVNTNELVTLGQLQAVSAGSSSAGVYSLPTGWSAESQSTMRFVGAIIYCRNLTEGGHTDWRVPTTEEFLYLLGETIVPLPSLTLNNQYWLRSPNLDLPGSTSSNTIARVNAFYFTGDWSTSYINATSTTATSFTICVR